jgi:hypothetical protein
MRSPGARLENLIPGLLATGLACGSWALPRPARACGATPCAQRMAVMPADGTTSVPTNTELRVLYFGTFTGHMADGAGCDLPLAHMRLVDAEGVAIDFDAIAEAAGEHQRWWVGRPPEPLRANARYRLQTQIGVQSCACSDPAVYSDVSEFTTGERQDAEPPDLAAIDRLDLAELVDATTTCGRTLGYPVNVVLAPAAPRAPDVSFDIHVDGELVKRYVASFEHELFVNCGTSALSLQTMLSPAARVRLRAVDLAGNVSALAPEIGVAADCTPGGGAAGRGNAGTVAGSAAPTADATVVDGDAGGAMRGTPESDSHVPTSSCTVARAQTPNALIAWLVAFAAAFVRRRLWV